MFAKDDVTEAVKDGENHCNVSQLEDDGTLDFNVIRTKLSSGLYSTVVSQFVINISFFCIFWNFHVFLFIC